MRYSIRVDRTDPQAFHVQVVRYANRKPVVVKHVGTAHTEEELLQLRSRAERWILEHPPQPSLFSSPVVDLRDCEYRRTLFTFTYEFLCRLCKHFQFTAFNDRILIDLVIMRIFEPASKLRSLSLLSKYFAIEHTELTLYRHLCHFPKLKDAVEQKMVAVAKEEFGFDFSFVLYDVTTLYFETVRTDTLRKPGFSKDNKPLQSQIVVGLMVTPQGFPVSYEVFAGNTFEGKTFLPSIRAFKELHKIETLTIVADAAMLSLENMRELAKEGLTYIVGARLGNIPSKLLETIDQRLEREDGKTMRTAAPQGTLVVGFSKKRYAKDLSEMNKQIKRAEQQVAFPGKMRRMKFVSVESEKPMLNNALIAHRRKLLGVKGYYTNLNDVSDTDIIAHYHSLWHVEQAFRIAKSDVVSRPIFHRKETSIRAHMLICVMALAISKYIEIKTGRSIRSVLDACKLVTDAVIVHRPSGRQIVMRSPIPDEVAEIERLLSHQR